MRKTPKTTIFTLISFLLLSGIAIAFPFIEVEGWVDPHSANFIDLGGGITKVEGLTYSFYVTDAASGAEMSYLSLEFENDVFSSVSDPYNYDPSDWTHDWAASTGSNYLLLDSGSTIGIGERLTFTVDVLMYSQALTDSSLWGEGQIWGQSWMAGDTLRRGDGGSTAPVPEPASLILLGTGVVGLVLGKKKFKKS